MCNSGPQPRDGGGVAGDDALLANILPSPSSRHFSTDFAFENSASAQKRTSIRSLNLDVTIMVLPARCSQITHQELFS